MDEILRGMKKAKHLKNILGFNLEEPFGAPFLRKLPSLKYIMAVNACFVKGLANAENISLFS